MTDKAGGTAQCSAFLRCQRLKEADRLEKNMKLLEQQFEKMKEELKQTYGNHEDIKH